VSDQAVTASQLLTADQLAERWQLERSQVYRLARDGRLPCVRLGRYRRFRLADIERFEADGGTDDE
jgi:excisionase family DNA binding protein